MSSESEHDAVAIVRDYLRAIETRDFARTRELTGPGFTMTYPGKVTMKNLEELVEWSAPRYNSVRKTFEKIDCVGSVVYCVGTLEGKWPNGDRFEGVRFTDRFELENGKIVKQDVFNDLSDVRPS